MTYDLIIIGMGPAGVSAAIYAKRAGLKILCFESKMIGGTLNFIDKIDNYPGLYNVSGPDFAYQLYQSLKELDIEVINKKIIFVKTSLLPLVALQKSLAYQMKNNY